MTDQDRRFVRVYRDTAGEADFVESALAAQDVEDDFPTTIEMPLEPLPTTTEFADSVVAEDIDFETMSAEMQHDFEESTFAATTKIDAPAAPRVEEKFFKEEWNGIDPLAEARRGMAAEEIDMSETSFSRFFEE